MPNRVKICFFEFRLQIFLFFKYLMFFGRKWWFGIFLWHINRKTSQKTTLRWTSWVGQIWPPPLRLKKSYYQMLNPILPRVFFSGFYLGGQICPTHEVHLKVVFWLVLGLKCHRNIPNHHFRPTTSNIWKIAKFAIEIQKSNFWPNWANLAP